MTKKEMNRSRRTLYERRRRLREGLRLAGILLLAALLALAARPGLLERVKRDAGQFFDRMGQYAGMVEPDRAERGSPPDMAAQSGISRTEGETGEGLTVHYLDVEKCNCVLVRSSDGHFMLIDAGSNDDAHTAKIISYLQDQGVETLDYLLITHPHRDHIRAVPQILDCFEVNEVLMGEFELETVGTKTYQRVLEALAAKDPLITRPQPGESYALGNASFTILANDDSIGTASDNLNNCSIGLIFMDGYHRFLFYGDGEEEMEEKLRESGFDLSCDVMMAAHHGSKSSTKRKTLEAMRPQIAVISCGIDGDGEKQEPSDKVLERLAEYGVKVYRTDLNGTVVVKSSETGLQVETEK